MGHYSPPWFAELQDVELVGDRAYVFDVGGRAIFDISTLQSPFELGRYEPIGQSDEGAAIQGGLIIACRHGDDLEIV